MEKDFISIIDFSILGFGGLFCLVWSAGLALEAPKKVDVASVFFIGISGLRLIWEGFTLSGYAYKYPFFYALPVPFLYLIGPMIFLFLERLAGNEKRRLQLLHFIPFFLAMLGWFFWYSQSNHEIVSRISGILNERKDSEDSIFMIWIIFPKFSIFFYSLWILVRWSEEGVNAFRLMKREVKWFSIILLIYILLMILTDIIGYLFEYPFLFQMSAWSHSFAAIIVFLYSKLNPSSILEISDAIKSVRYSNTKLERLDHETELRKLKELMEKDSYFADEDLRLSNVAEAMKISPHQLSELINVYHKTNFANFINQHRIKAACLMIQEDKRNILSIAFAVGFNSKSAFNRAFKQFLGCSPVEYRRNPREYNFSKNLKS